MVSVEKKGTLDEEIYNNPRLKDALDRGIDSVESGRVISKDEAIRMLGQRIEMMKRGNRVVV